MSQAGSRLREVDGLVAAASLRRIGEAGLTGSWWIDMVAETLVAGGTGLMGEE